MTRSDQELLRAILRSDFQSFLQRCLVTLNPGQPFLSNWHIRALDHYLDLVRRGQITRLIINLPPRHLKSLMVSVAFPAFLLGHEPHHRIFAVSYGTDLSLKHARDFRAIVESPWFRQSFSKMRIARSLDDEVTTTAKGFRKATSVGGPLTGMGGDMFIIDDPLKPADAQSEPVRNKVNQWVANTLMSRLDNKEKGVIIVVMQRVHMDDLSGFLAHSSSEWEVLSLPAIAEIDEEVAISDSKFHKRLAGEALHPEHESLEVLQKLRDTLGSTVFAAQYQQCPVPPGGAMIKREWLNYYDVLPERTAQSKVIQSWDTAAKDGAQNCWSVCTTWLIHDKKYYLLDLVRDRYEYPRLRKVAIALAERFRPDVVLVEDASTGQALVPDLKSVLCRPVRPVPIERDKIGRLYVQQAKFEAGLVFLFKHAPYLSELEAELLAFPNGRTSDQVDSISQALNYQGRSYDATFSWVE